MFYVIWNETEDYSWTRGIDRQYSDSSGTKKKKKKNQPLTLLPLHPHKNKQTKPKKLKTPPPPCSSPDRQHNSVQNSTEEATA